MWMTLLALRNSIAILMASLAVVVLGLVALDRLPVDLFPNINLPIINVGTVYTGAGVLDVEKTVTYPIEKAVSAISDVKFVESKSRQGLSTVRVWMNWGADVNEGQTEVIQRIQQILNTLPRGIKQPFIVRYDLSNIPVALITVSGGRLDERQLYDLAYNIIEPQVERLGGVASAGGRPRRRLGRAPPTQSCHGRSCSILRRPATRNEVGARARRAWRQPLISQPAGSQPVTLRSTA